MQSLHWYGKYVYKNPGMTKDNSNKYIGVARLRQHRSNNITCIIPELIKFLNMSCKPEYYTSPEYRDFSERWQSLEDSNRSDSRMSQAWIYSSAAESKAMPYTGNVSKFKC